MRYVIAIEPGTDDQAFGVAVPDLPGCFSAGDTVEAAIDNAREAIEAWAEAVLDDGGEIPAQRSIDALRNDPEYDGWIWAIIEAPTERLQGPSERVNISLPKRVLVKIDEYATAHGETRSAFLAKAALDKIAAG